MKFLSALTVLGALYVSSATADTLYNNGLLTGVGYGYDITGSAVTNSFTLGSQSTLTGLNFATWSISGNVPNTAPPSLVSWEISNTPLSNTPIASGSATINASYQGLDSNTGQEIYLDKIILPNINLAAGSYWIELLSANNNTPNPVLWNQSASGIGQAYISDPSGPSSISSEEFQVIGSVSAVPLPAAVWLFGTVLMGWLGVCKYRQKPTI